MTLAKRFVVGLLFVFITACATVPCDVVPNVRTDRRAFMSYIQDRSVSIEVTCELKMPEEILKAIRALGFEPKKVVKKGGSGTIVKSTSSRSFILTAAHVTADEDFYSCSVTKVTSTHAGVKDEAAYLIFNDSDNDVAVLAVNKNLGVSTQIASSSYLGQHIYVVGFPFIMRTPNRYYTTESISITTGVVATHMYDKNNTLKVFRFTADAYFGNSGGGVFDSSGRLLGVVSFMSAGTTEEGKTIPISGHYFARPFTVFNYLF